MVPWVDRLRGGGACRAWGVLTKRLCSGGVPGPRGWNAGPPGAKAQPQSPPLSHLSLPMAHPADKAGLWRVHAGQPQGQCGGERPAQASTSSWTFGYPPSQHPARKGGLPAFLSCLPGGCPGVNLHPNSPSLACDMLKEEMMEFNKPFLRAEQLWTEKCPWPTPLSPRWRQTQSLPLSAVLWGRDCHFECQELTLSLGVSDKKS